MTKVAKGGSLSDGDRGLRHLEGLDLLVSVVQELSLVRSLDALMAIVRRAARELTGADGATFVLREGTFCHYADEFAIAPLWKGRRFPMEQCISGWTMLHREPAVIDDIYADPRIPADAYRPTFVKSLVMVPIRTVSPVGAIGNYWARHHRATPDEVKLLCALADSTSVAMENVELYATLERRVQERTAALAASQAELGAQHAALVRLQRQKEEMAALLVHDLRSPASGILMTSRARLRKADVPESDRKDWKTVQAGAEVIARLALNLLDISRGEEGTFAARPEPLDLRRLLDEVVQVMTPLAEGRGQTLELGVDLAGGTVHADGELLGRALQNLIDNAVRHSPSGSAVRVRARSTGSDVEISVLDEGSGVPHAMRERIFEKYARIDDPERRDETGRGLGLAFCRLAIEGHGGRISVDDNAPRGSIFTIRLPVGSRPGHRAAADGVRRQAMTAR